jgi:hypothetical protein
MNRDFSIPNGVIPADAGIQWCAVRARRHAAWHQAAVRFADSSIALDSGLRRNDGLNGRGE